MNLPGGQLPLFSLTTAKLTRLLLCGICAPTRRATMTAVLDRCRMIYRLHIANSRYREAGRPTRLHDAPCTVFGRRENERRHAHLGGSEVGALRLANAPGQRALT